jgi:hypothetical protein
MDRSSYLDLRHPDEGRERTAYFVLDSLLRSRIDCGFESNSTRYDEDVNVYLVHLLTSLVSSLGLLIRTPEAEVADHDVDVFEKIRDSDDPRLKSRVYRMNADHLLVSASLFTQTPYVEVEGQRVWHAATRDRIGRGKAYYHYASTFQERIRSVSPALARVLGLLSEDFERYVDVLFHMRGEYFHLYRQLGDADLRRLQEGPRPEAPAPDSPEDVAAGRDAFLDAYWAWHECPTPETRAALEATVIRLRSVDPGFRFEFPED